MPGYYTNTTGSAACIGCPPGTKLADEGGPDLHDSLGDCEACGVLSFNPFVGKTDCYLCLTAESAGSTTCDGCDPGLYKQKLKH